MKKRIKNKLEKLGDWYGEAREKATHRRDVQRRARLKNKAKKIIENKKSSDNKKLSD
jgi:hypothetical protein